MTTLGSAPQVCWKSNPYFGAAYWPDRATLTLVSATITNNNTLKIVPGGDIFGDPIKEYPDGTYANETIEIKGGRFIIFLDGEYYDDPQSKFDIIYSTSDERVLKPALAMLISVAFAFFIPLVLVSMVRCCCFIKDKNRMRTRKKVMFYLATIFSLVILAIILSRKIGI
ncbi:hypothetical protein CYY_000149 [Polysphondylium violaceum]|uniref:Uncharacterized protein n=1 Tax=Polysphondylium violaceum TaxID=133409 RepID=A0A8J4VBU0_9MYCE|nr:hypothetical protein CYY_000149 [Polysphondylium violaceum]